MQQKHICLQLEKGSWIIISFDDILYIEAGDSYATFITTRGNYLSLSSLNTLADGLPDNFCRVHRSYIIAVGHVQKMGLDHVRIATHDIPVSKQYRPELLKKYFMP